MDSFKMITEYFCDSVSECLVNIPETVKSKIIEIRAKVDKPIVIVTTDGRYFLNGNGVSEFLPNRCVCTDRNQFNECIKRMCGYSFCAYENQINNGYITLKSGHRVGICGSFSNKGVILSCNDIYSFNFRIARFVKSFGIDVVDRFLNDGNHLLLSGKPACGKTTLIRDVARCLSDKKIKTCVIDERNEIAANFFGETGFELGAFCDVISNCSKATASEIALRTMSPDVIIFDEIGFNDCETMHKISNAGVKVIASFHSFSDTGNSFILEKLRQYGFFATLLKMDKIGEMPKFDYSYVYR